VERSGSIGPEGEIVYVNVSGQLRNVGLGPAVDAFFVVTDKQGRTQTVAIGAVSGMGVRVFGEDETRIAVTIHTPTLSGLAGTSVKVVYANAFGAEASIEFCIRWYVQPGLKDGGYYKLQKLRSQPPPYRRLEEQRRHEVSPHPSSEVQHRDESLVKAGQGGNTNREHH
jgi:hypothetical protein